MGKEKEKNRFIEWYTINKSSIDNLLFKDPENVNSIAKCFVQCFTTKKFCKKFDICETDDYQQNEVRIPTNDELDNFFQNIYHAGTTEQFFRYANFPKNLSSYFYSEFHYIFDIFKKGIFVYIHNGDINTFLPFSNTTYRNDWGQNLKTNGGNFKNVLELEEKNHYVPNFIPHEYHTMIQKDPNKWYANSYIFRNTIYKNGKLRFKDDEGDKSIVNFLQLLIELCYERVIPDVCFFINPRDFPILLKDRTHPYDKLYLPNKPPYLGDMYKIIDSLPIFSQSTTNDYDDELIPNDDDIVGILCDSKRELYNTNWSSKKSKAVFRGSATGYGTTEKNNPRINIYELAKKHEDIMDVKLIGLNDKIKVDEKGYVQIINRYNFPKMDKNYKISNSLSPKQQAGFKYIIHIQGHVAAFRLTRELGYGSLILKLESDWKTWYSDKLIGWKAGDNSIQGKKLRDTAHYIIVTPESLVDTIKWCMQSDKNDEICSKIAQRALEFYRKHFMKKDHMLSYMQEKLCNISLKQKSIVSNIKGLIVIPFRDDDAHERQKQLDQLIDFIQQNIDKNKLHYVVMVQEDKNPFNRGLLLNKGVVMNPDYDYYILHDADLIPDQDLLKYYYKYPKSPIHLGYRGQRWSETKEGTNKKFIGGVLSINKFDYYNANGIPNTMQGWSGEDDALSYRLMVNKIKIEIPPKGAVTDLEGLTIEQKLDKLRKTNQINMKKREQLEENKKNWPYDGIKQLKKQIQIL